jgi:hypothetical protein
MKCFFCNASFTTATGVVHHLESGSCPNAPLDRQQLYRAVRARDPQGVISKNLLECDGDTEYEATERAWSRRDGAYKCYICGRTFARLVSLNQHLSSPVHQQSLYQCPNRGCSKDFSTLGALINHLESESCQFMSFQAVQDNLKNLVCSNRRIRF